MIAAVEAAASELEASSGIVPGGPGLRTGMSDPDLSCPNVEKGTQFATDTTLLRETVKSCRQATDALLVAKLSPNVTDIVPYAETAASAGRTRLPSPTPGTASASTSTRAAASWPAPARAVRRGHPARHAVPRLALPPCTAGLAHLRQRRHHGRKQRGAVLAGRGDGDTAGDRDVPQPEAAHRATVRAGWPTWKTTASRISARSSAPTTTRRSHPSPACAWALSFSTLPATRRSSAASAGRTILPIIGPSRAMPSSSSRATRQGTSHPLPQKSTGRRKFHVAFNKLEPARKRFAVQWSRSVHLTCLVIGPTLNDASQRVTVCPGRRPPAL